MKSAWKLFMSPSFVFISYSTRTIYFCHVASRRISLRSFASSLFLNTPLQDMAALDEDLEVESSVMDEHEVWCFMHSILS